jgi:hypothetical protein
MHIPDLYADVDLQMLKQRVKALEDKLAKPKREWVGLTQEERDELLNYSTSVPSRLIDWTEEKLKEKNSD